VLYPVELRGQRDRILTTDSSPRCVRLDQFKNLGVHGMTQLFAVHPTNPQPRAMGQAAELISQGGVLAIPTDSGYALVAHLDDKDAADALRRFRGLDARHHLTLLCRDLSEIGQFAKVDNQQYRLLKLATPGPWTFILTASREVPKRVSHPSRKTIGIRVPNHPVTSALLELVGAPVLATTLILPGQESPLVDPEDVREALGKQLAGIIDAGRCPWQPTTIVDLSGSVPEVLRLGAGDPASIGL
jgi:tRNA threonylcarbamoyl adenosine modification protein (Sua5/YciO/YrdC/YwlC family)